MGPMAATDIRAAHEGNQTLVMLAGRFGRMSVSRRTGFVFGSVLSLEVLYLQRNVCVEISLFKIILADGLHVVPLILVI